MHVSTALYTRAFLVCSHGKPDYYHIAGPDSFHSLLINRHKVCILFMFIGLVTEFDFS